MRKLYTFLFATLAFCGLAQAQKTLKWVASEQGYENAQEVTTVALDDVITATFDAGGNSNTPKYYNTGSGVRLYGSNSMTISGSTISEIVITYSGAANAGEITTSPEGYTLNDATGVWSGNATSVTFTRGGSSGHVRIQSIEVTYGDIAPDYVAAPRISPATGTYFAAQEVTISSSDSTAAIYYTTDGSTPTAASKAYTAPFTVSTTTTVKAIAVKDNNSSEVAESVITIETLPTYNTIESMQAAAQNLGTDKPDIQFVFRKLTVTGVKGSNIYVTDGQRGLLLYGTNSKDLKVDDVICGTIAGKLQLYNGITELGSADYTGVNILEAESPMPSVKAAIADVTGDATKLQFESMLVTIEDVNIVKDGNGYKLLDESDNEVILYDNYGVQFAELGIDSTATYNVTAIVGSYKGTIQLYPRTAADIVKASEADLQTPVSGWDTESVIATVGDVVSAKFTTNSDAKVTYSSSNEAVATIDDAGNIAIVGAGKTIITAETAATATFKSDLKSFTLTVTSGATGTIDKPYSVADVLAFGIKEKTDTIQTEAWVKGYIVGFVNGNAMSKCAFELNDSVLASNIILADAPDVKDAELVIPVALPSGKDARANLNLRDNPNMLGQQVWLCGTITLYMQANGLKDVSKYSLTGIDAVRSINANATTDGAIYTISGQRVSRITKAGIYVVGGRKVIVK